MKKKLSVSALCRVAFLIALTVVLSRFGSINAMGLRIGFAFVPVALCAVLYGPYTAAAAYAAADILGVLLFPTGPYFPGFTLSAAITGFVYGIFLHRKDFWRDAGVASPGAGTIGAVRARTLVYIFSATFINCILIGLCLNTLWLAILYGRGYIYWFTMRLMQYAVLVPLNIILLPFVVKLADRIKLAVK